MEGMLGAAGPRKGGPRVRSRPRSSGTPDNWEGDSRSPAPETHLSEGCRRRLRDGRLVGKGTWDLSPGTASTWVEDLQGRLGGALPPLPSAGLAGLGDSVFSTRGAAGRPASRGSRGPRPATPAPAGGAETRVRGGGRRGCGGGRAAPALEGTR